MIRQILDVRNPILRKKSKPVTSFDKRLKNLVKDLIDTLVAQKDPEGVGLAASQIGKNVSVFVMRPKDEIFVIINPQIISISKEKNMPKNKTRKKIMEGCLSLPHYYGPLTRAKKVTLRYYDENGKEIVRDFDGLAAQIVQHEMDHLNGVLFIDRLLQSKTPLYEYVDGEWEKVDLIV